MPERIAAKAAGERFYTTGKPCANGHLSKRYTVNGLCQACVAKNVKSSAAKHQDHPAQAIARAAGETHYWTGVACRNGHVAMRFVHNGNCVECRAASQVRFHKAHPELGAKWARDRYANDPEPHRKSSRKWAKKNPENVRANQQKTIDRNPEYWRKKRVVYTQTHLARKRANGGTFTDVDIEAIFVAQDGKCAGCRHTKKLEIDHILPVSRGGSSDRSNLQLLCRTCNASKGGKTMEEWRHWLSSVT